MNWKRLIAVLALTGLPCIAATDISLLNVDFTNEANPAFSTKTGVAAVGLSETDYWNPYNSVGAQNAPLKWSDGTASPVRVSGPSTSLWFVWNSDPMFGSDLIVDGQFQFFNLPSGTYDVLVYAHGWMPMDFGSIEAIVGSKSYGAKTTSTAANWDLPDWTEGNHYVRYNGVTIANSEILKINSHSYINGLQIIKTAAAYPPAISEPPLNQNAVAGSRLILTHKKVGTGPFTYQWTKNGADIPNATGESLTIPTVAATDAGLYRVRVSNSAGVATSSPASVRVIQPSVGSLLNVDFRTASPMFRYAKTGPAAIGMSFDDIWNTYGNSTSVSNLVWSSGNPSPITLSINSISGPWFTPSNDPMLQSYIHNGSSEFAADLAGFKAGKYSFYVYAHGQAASDDGVIELRVGDNSLGIKTTSVATDWRKADWVENSQYVRFANVAIAQGQAVQIVSRPGFGNRSVLNGLQILFDETPTAPRITMQPAGATGVEGSTVSLEVTAEGTDPMRFQWFKEGEALPGATSRKLTFAPLVLTNAGNYKVRVENSLGFTISSNAVVTVNIDHDAPIITLLSPVAGFQESDIFTLQGSIADAYPVTARWELNGVSQGSLALPGNAFNVANRRFINGTNTVSVIATDVSGNSATNTVIAIWTLPRNLILAAKPTVQEGTRVVIPVMLVSTGGVSGATFVIGFDTNRLADPVFEWSPTLSLGFTTVNLQESKAFRATFALPGTSFPEGDAQLATIAFRTRSVSAATETPITLSLEDISSETGEQYASGNSVIPTMATITKRRVIGDNNANNRLDVGDASVILRFVAGTESPRPWDVSGNDLNGSATIDSGDVIKVLRTVVGLDPQPTVPASRAQFVLPAGSGIELVSSKPVVAAGDTFTVEARLVDQTAPLQGASFRLNYPTGALRLDSSETGSMIPKKALGLWNRQPGFAAFGATDFEAWAQSSGTIARFTFTALSTGATVALNNFEVTNDGFETASLAGTELTLRAPARFASKITFSANKAPQLTLVGSAGSSYLVEASSNLFQWSAVGTFAAGGDGSVQVEDAAGIGAAVRFYRATLIF
jgi:hypothetical protein